jgi:hypothetical protein
MNAIVPKELLTATAGGLSVLIVSGGADGHVLTQQADGTYAPEAAAGGRPGGSTGQVQYNNDGAFGGMTAVVYAGTGSHVTITSQAASTIPLCIKGAASQSGPLIETQNSGGTRLLWIDPSSATNAEAGRLRHGAKTAYFGWYSSDWLSLDGGNGTLCFHAFVWGSAFTARLRTDGTISLQTLASDSANNATLYCKNGELYWRGGAGTITKLANS